ncbi:hypothetical protein FJR48_08660 [Sulfurimonas lithotrophica]|uniref:site-specific DNA-methyltransferase (cytosine-N(4)-specific) n=1 Tax=Sulfurimonas lithotrophica TaxID=2590022 RepID=A0A5P8P239_9BACT|nr:hypothetical protein [Sulfurimonas lithotrophica]QFR49798.1 hypothetical protein FJR48_08660 [Sulfurimonas lithotrophica]
MDYNIVDYSSEYKGLMQFNKNKSEYIHQWYSFVEGYSKEFIESILNELNYTPLHCLEPFAGSGTTPLELQKKKIACTSFEVNPFMHKLATTKMETRYTTKAFIRSSKLVKDIIEDSAISMTLVYEKLSIPKYKTIVEGDQLKKWMFNKDIFDTFMKIKYAISFVKDSKYKNIFEIACASLLLKYSNVYRNGKCLSYKRDWKDLDLKKEDLLFEFYEKLNITILNDIKKLNELTKNELVSNKQNCYYGDIRKSIATLKDNSVDLVITSPPYLNTRDYTDIYMIELWMLDLIKDYDSLKKLRKSTLRSHVQVAYDDLTPLKIDILTNVVDEINKHKNKFWNRNLLNMIIGYFEDMNILFYNLSKKLTNYGKIYFNVANSSYYGVLIEVDKIIAEIAKLHGFKIEEIRIAREISPSAQQKEVGKLRESVIVIKK